MAGGAAKTVLRAVQCPCSSCAIMKSFGPTFLRLDALPDVNHLRGMQYQNSTKSYFPNIFVVISMCLLYVSLGSRVSPSIFG